MVYVERTHRKRREMRDKRQETRVRGAACGAAWIVKGRVCRWWFTLFIKAAFSRALKREREREETAPGRIDGKRLLDLTETHTRVFINALWFVLS